MDLRTLLGGTNIHDMSDTVNEFNISQFRKRIEILLAQIKELLYTLFIKNFQIIDFSGHGGSFFNRINYDKLYYLICFCYILILLIKNSLANSITLLLLFVGIYSQPKFPIIGSVFLITLICYCLYLYFTNKQPKKEKKIEKPILIESNKFLSR